MTELLSLASWCSGFALACAVCEVVWVALASDQDAELPTDPWADWIDLGGEGKVQR